MKINELTESLKQIDQKIKLERGKIAEGRRMIKEFLCQVSDLESEARNIKKQIKRLNEEAKYDDPIHPTGVWVELRKIGLTKREIYLMQNLQSNTYVDLAKTIGISGGRASVIVRHAIRKCQRELPKIIGFDVPECDDAAWKWSQECFISNLCEEYAKRVS